MAQSGGSRAFSFSHLGSGSFCYPPLTRLPFFHSSSGIVASPTRPTAATAEAEEATPAPVWGWAVAFAAGLALLLVSVFGGHTLDVKTHPALAMLADWLHLTAMSLWFGGLILIVSLVPAFMQKTAGTTQRQTIAAMIAHFSRLALISVAVLAVTGTYAITEHTTRDTLATTTYGLVVIGKVALVLGIVLVAALNRFALKRWIARDPNTPETVRAQTMLMRGMNAEVILGVAVIGLTGLLTQLPPANTQATSAFTSVPVSTAAVEVIVPQPILESNGVRGVLTVTTNGPDATFDVRISDSAGVLLNNVTRTMLWLNSGDRDVGVITVPLQAAEDGHYHATGQWFAIGQNWLARIVVRRQDIAEDVVLPYAIQPRPTAYAEEPIPPSPFLWPRLLPDARYGFLAFGIGLALLLVAFRPVARRTLQRASWASAIGLIALGLLVAAWYSVPTTPLSGKKNPVPVTADVIAQAGILYAQNCAVCHGPNGAGTGKPGSQLTASTAHRYTDGDLYWLLTNGIAGKGMPAFSTRLSPTERWQVVQYLRSITAQQ